MKRCLAFLIVALVPFLARAQSQTGGLPALREEVQWETNSRIAADVAEANARIAADGKEAAARADADVALQANITAETSARTNADQLEAAARVKGDSDTLAAAKAYADTRPGPVGPTGPIGPTGPTGPKGDPGSSAETTLEVAPALLASTVIAFVKVYGMSGGVTDRGHEQWSELTAFTFSASKDASAAAVLNSAVFGKSPDSSSDEIAKALVDGRTITSSPAVVVEFCDRYYAGTICTLRYEFKDVRITSYAPGTQTETVVFSFAKVDIKARKYNCTTGGCNLGVEAVATITPTSPPRSLIAAPTDGMTTPAGQDAKAFLKVMGVIGDYSNRPYENWIALTGMTNFAVTRYDDLGGSGRFKFSGNPIITKDVDIATPILVQRMMDGTIMNEVTIEVLEGAASRGGGGAMIGNSVRYVFNGVRLTSYSIGVSDSGQPSESYSMDFRSVTATYYKGAIGGSQIFTFTLSEASP